MAIKPGKRHKALFLGGGGDARAGRLTTAIMLRRIFEVSSLSPVEYTEYTPCLEVSRFFLIGHQQKSYAETLNERSL